MTSDAFPAETFARRRSRLMRRLRAGSAAIFAAGHDSLRNGDVEHPFRQPSSFYYLTGFDEPDAVAVLRPGHDEPFVLFVRPHDPAMAVWVGARLGVDGAVDELGADAAYPIEELEQRLPQLLAGAGTVYYSLGSDERVERLFSRVVAQRRAAAQGGARPIEAIMDPAPLVAEQRVIKSRDEVVALQRAIDITGAGLEAAMRATRPGMHEYEVQAILEAEYRRLGSPRDGFPSIVAAGANACTLHYTANRAEMARNELLLVDTGAEVDFYGADVTRTSPVDGRFRAAARDVYELVLEAQEQATELIRPGVRFHDVHDKAAEVLTQGLLDLGVLSGDLSSLIEQRAFAPFFMHGTSHWLGMDVHDVGRYREGEESVELRPGMVLTVEPGLYFAPGIRGVPRRLRGIGVRIEDDVLVTRDGYRVLSGAIPKQPDDLEAIVGSG
ncbi:MAG: aminopeptidase P N-terminal domain-containing protein [Chloroflexi bacterium]|nr:aminopeptidase P N-terminal domain-containing protein [Chloroflexota bacterium]